MTAEHPGHDLASRDHPGSPDRPRNPTLIIFDVNETLSDMSPIARRVEDVGAPAHLASSWFAGLLRDGFALTVVSASDTFAHLAEESLRISLHGHPLNRDPDDAVQHILGGFTVLPVHPDVPDGVHALTDLGIRLVTLSNGSAAIAEGLLDRASIRDDFEALLSVEDAGAWKPDLRAYAHALTRCEVGPMDAMLVAVHPWDIDGAARAGLGTAWINRNGEPYPRYFRSPDIAATSLTDLADQLHR